MNHFIKICGLTIFFFAHTQLQAQIGKVGINTAAPAGMLHVKDSSVVFTSPFYENMPLLDAPPPVSGMGARMLWYPQRRAFRSGMVSGTHWDRSKTGFYSMASGYNTTANGDASTAFGRDITANGYASTIVGLYNDPIVGTPQTNIEPTTPLFVVGNGDAGLPSNALVVRKDGRIGIGVNVPSDVFHLNATTSNAFRVSINNATKFRIYNNGGTALGALITPPNNGLYVHGAIEPAGGIVSPTNPIQINSQTDSVVIQSGNNKIVVYADGGIKIIGANSAGNGITIDAGNQNLVLKGQNVTIQSAATTTIDANGNLNLEASGISNLIGTQVKLNNGTIPAARLGSTVIVNTGTGLGSITGNGSSNVFVP